jgi:hypothetical protein
VLNWFGLGLRSVARRGVDDGVLGFGVLSPCGGTAGGGVDGGAADDDDFGMFCIAVG